MREGQNYELLKVILHKKSRSETDGAFFYLNYNNLVAAIRLVRQSFVRVTGNLFTEFLIRIYMDS